MGNKKERRCKCTCSDFWNWVIKIIGIVLLAIIIAQLCFDKGCCNYNAIALTLVLSFIGTLATFVVVNNFSQVYKIERKAEQSQTEITKIQVEAKDFFDNVSVADSYYVNYHAGYYGNDSDTQRRSMFICCIVALDMYSKVVVFDVSNRINGAIKGLKEMLGVGDKYSKIKYKIPLNQKDIEITNDIFNSLLNSSSKFLTRTHKEEIKEIQERFNKLFKTE